MCILLALLIGDWCLGVLYVWGMFLTSKFYIMLRLAFSFLLTMSFVWGFAQTLPYVDELCHDSEVKSQVFIPDDIPWADVDPLDLDLFKDVSRGTQVHEEISGDEVITTKTITYQRNYYPEFVKVPRIVRTTSEGTTYYYTVDYEGPQGFYARTTPGTYTDRIVYGLYKRYTWSPPTANELQVLIDNGFSVDQSNTEVNIYNDTIQINYDLIHNTCTHHDPSGTMITSYENTIDGVAVLSESVTITDQTLSGIDCGKKVVTTSYNNFNNCNNVDVRSSDGAEEVENNQVNFSSPSYANAVNIHFAEDLVGKSVFIRLYDLTGQLLSSRQTIVSHQSLTTSYKEVTKTGLYIFQYEIDGIVSSKSVTLLK